MSVQAPQPSFWAKWIAALTVAWGLWLLGGRWLLGQPLRLPVYLAALVWMGLGVALGVSTYHTWALSRLRYTVTRDGITVRWGWNALFVPMGALEATGHDLPSLPRVWWRWPAIHVGQRMWQGRQVFCFVSRPEGDLCFLQGPEVGLLLSPPDSRKFVDAINQRRALGPNRPQVATWLQPRWASWPLWSDPTALLALAAIGVMALVFWSEVARRAGMGRLQLIAQLTTFLVFLNVGIGLLLHARERLATLLLWWGSAGLLFLLFIGLWTGTLRL